MSFNEAIGWTDYAKERLDPKGIIGYKPLRGKKFLFAETNLSAKGYNINPLSTAKGIVRRDSYDVRTCNAVLVNVLDAKRVSIGTVCEVAFAYILNKPVVLVMEPEGNIHEHCFITEMCDYWVHDLDHGIEIIQTILLD